MLPLQSRTSRTVPHGGTCNSRAPAPSGLGIYALAFLLPLSPTSMGSCISFTSRPSRKMFLSFSSSVSSPPRHVHFSRFPPTPLSLIVPTLLPRLGIHDFSCDGKVSDTHCRDHHPIPLHFLLPLFFFPQRTPLIEPIVRSIYNTATSWSNFRPRPLPPSTSLSLSLLPHGQRLMALPRPNVVCSYRTFRRGLPVFTTRLPPTRH